MVKRGMKLFCFLTIFFFNIDNTFSQTDISMPKVNMRYSVLKIKDGQDSRDLSNNEIKISFYINDVRIDEYNDFGSGSYSKEEMTFYLESDISQKYYTISIINKSQILVSYMLYFEGEERLIWKNTYSLNNNKWVKSKCDGDCS